MHIKEYDTTYLVEYNILKDSFYYNVDLRMIIHTSR